MNPVMLEDADIQPNYWLSCLIINKDSMCKQIRGEQEALYVSEPGKTCPIEILDALAAFNVEGRPIWKPMHMQPIYRMNGFVTKDGNGRGRSIYSERGVPKEDAGGADVGRDIFYRGLCLPSDNKMTPKQQDVVIDIIRKCFE
ncbi:MAG: aminotransferase DegT, partial [Lachnospiraceae bacterium]|nr:aminotransferase DegT [Lachnospiraceae bacterium]